MTEKAVQKVDERPLTLQQLVKSDAIIKSAERTLGEKGRQFLTSVLALANSDEKIAECDPMTTYNACLTAATLDLPVNQNLGFAYIVPYRNKGKMEAQFQMGWRGFVQLAMKSGQFQDLGPRAVHEGELIGVDEFTGAPKFNFQLEKKGKIIGYMAYMVMLNGFRKAEFMSVEEIEKHAKRYSQKYRKYGDGQWKDNFDAMAKKTVLKLLLSRYAPLSIEMQKAIEQDQKVGDEYADNKPGATLEVEDAEVGIESIEVVAKEVENDN